ncbi:hypothetical protein [Pseudomonas sp. S9]|uniref:hypothetical protein n=1 Tax=Pseudomonas sp. S9 TaxID=686578 RepID=UPI000307F3C9|nr:hypothetical protein [Pseudomonas sp. S9]
MTSQMLAISLRTLFVSALLLVSTLSQAATAPADSLLTLHQMRLDSQKNLSSFYMYNNMEGDQRYAQMINESLSNASQALATLQDLSGDSSKALSGQLVGLWNDYQNNLKNLVETLKTQGYTDLQPVADLAEQNQKIMALSEELYNKIQQETGYSVPPLIQQSRKQSLLMQAIAVDYSSRSASVGATFMGGGDSRSMEELVNEFAATLKALSQAPENTAQTTKTLNNVGTKWHYIEKSLKNYNENSVPFLVSKYSDSIIDELEQLSSQYAAAST